jgi:hypothetical protein
MCLVAERFTLLLACLMSGCVSVSDYPTDWAPIDKSFRSDVSRGYPCPHLTGRFEPKGLLSPLNPANMCMTGTEHYEWALDWLCETSLVRNLAPDQYYEKEHAALADSPWIELQLPDANTLRIGAQNPAVHAIELHRSLTGFSCSSEGLRRVQHDIWRVAANAGDPGGHENPAGRVIAGASATLAAPVFAYGGFVTLTRTFNTTTDGSLVMKITHSRHGVTFFIPTYEKSSTYVMWKRVNDAPEVPEFLPTIGRSINVAPRAGPWGVEALMMYGALSTADTAENRIDAYKWMTVVWQTSTDRTILVDADRIRTGLVANMSGAQIAEGAERALEWIDAFAPSDARSKGGSP